jgi:hypothetical protein
MGGSRLKLCFGWRFSGRKQFEQELGNVADLVELLKELKSFSQRKKFLLLGASSCIDDTGKTNEFGSCV